MRFTHENEDCVIDNCAVILNQVMPVMDNMEQWQCYTTAVMTHVHNPGWWQLAYMNTTYKISLIYYYIDKVNVSLAEPLLLSL